MANLFMHGVGYKLFRPTYPEACFTSLVQQLDKHGVKRGLVVDMACGSGQATVGLAKIFDKVVGVDASEPMLQSAEKGTNIEYRVGSSETITSLFAPNSVDCIVVAQALHWFDIPKFYRDCHVVLKDNGVLAVWGYGLNKMSTPAADADVFNLYETILGPYWDKRRYILDSGYKNCDFPSPLFHSFERVPNIEILWSANIDSYKNYLRTWSSYQTFIKTEEGKQRKPDPVDETGLRLLQTFKNDGITSLTEGELKITWPLFVMYGAKSANASNL